jgi:PTS system cellobiose-specific IIB component
MEIGKVASMRILVVCGAGASSTFVAQRLRRAALGAGLDWDTFAGTEQTAASAGADLVLVGPHLSERLSTIRDHAACPVLVLPDDVFTDRDGTRTLALVQSATTFEKGTP